VNENVRDGTRCSPSRAYLWPVMGNQHLTVLTEALAVKLTLSGARCTGLDCLLDGQVHSVRASREVILCAGAIHTPRLLLLSGIGRRMTSNNGHRHGHRSPGRGAEPPRPSYDRSLL